MQVLIFRKLISVFSVSFERRKTWRWRKANWKWTKPHLKLHYNFKNLSFGKLRSQNFAGNWIQNKLNWPQREEIASLKLLNGVKWLWGQIILSKCSFENKICHGNRTSPFPKRRNWKGIFVWWVFWWDFSEIERRFYTCN